MSVPIEQLYQILAATLLPDKTQRQAAENALKQLNQTQGDVVNLLRVACEDQVDLAIRQTAAIVFKNMCRRRWETEGESGVTQICDADKEAVRANLLEGVVRTPAIISSQLIECLRMIVYSDFPDPWSGLLQQIEQNLSSGDTRRVIGGLSAMRMIARRYEYCDHTERQPYYQVINNTWPALLQLFHSLLAHTDASIELATMLKLLLKIYWSSTYIEIPGALLQQQMFDGWLGGILALIVRPVPTEGCPEDPEDRAKWPWWKVKKWALHIGDRLFSRYGSPKLCRDRQEDATFSKMFEKQMALRFLEGTLTLLASKSSGAYMSPRAMNLALRVVTHCLTLPYTYPVMKPHIQDVIQHVVFPLLCFNDEDQELWEDDPHEYIRKGYDLMEDLYSVRTAASNFITELCENKTASKDHMDGLMAFIVNVFTQFQAQGGAASTNQQAARLMDGGLLAVGSLAEELKRKKKYKPSIEPMIIHHVLPCFASPFPHLRSKACWVAGQFCDFKFAEGVGIGATFTTLLQRVCEMLRDPQLPVRVDATVALRSLVDSLDDMSILGPSLPAILDAFFQLMNEVENEDLVFTLETIVEKFGDDIAPYAVLMCQNLAKALWQISQKSKRDDGEDDNLARDDDADEDDGDMSALAAYGCLRALSTILESVSAMKHLYPNLEAVLFPVISEMIGEADMFEEVLELLAYLTYYGPSISDQLWTLWPKIHAGVMEWGIDSFASALMVLDNFIGRGTDRFLATSEYQQSVFEMARYAMTDKNILEEDAKPGAKLLEVVLQQCRGRVDHWVAPYLQVTLQAMEKAETPSYQDMLITVVANCLHYNAALTLNILKENGALAPLLGRWFTMIYAQKGKPGKATGGPKHFRRIHDKKVACLGLLAVLALPAEQLPAEVAAGLPQLTAGLIRLLGYLKDHYEREELEANESDDDDDEGEDEEDEDEDEDGEDDFLAELDDKGMERLAKRGMLGGDDEDDDEDDFTDDEEYESPLDTVDAFVTFREMLHALQQAQPQKLQAATTGLDGSAQTAMQEAITYADKRVRVMREQAEKKAKEAAKNAANHPTLGA